MAAVDLGATSGRVVLGRVNPSGLTYQDIHRFPNHPIRIRDGLHWNILELYRNVLEGLRKAVAIEPNIVSVGIDSWAIDYGLVRDGRLIGTPYHYRDDRTLNGAEGVEAAGSKASLYRENGLQFLPFTTLNQLAVDQDTGLLDDRTCMLLIPDLIAYWLTGQQRAERTNASTTGLLNIHTSTWNEPLRRKLGLPSSLLPQLIDPGQPLGSLTKDVAQAIGAATLDVVAVGSHDTASAVVAVPLTGPGDAYICSGTWSLIGKELLAPITSEVSRTANFTNELGVDGRIRYLRNTMGMWVLNECLNAWTHADGRTTDLAELLHAADANQRWAAFDVDHPSLLPAGDMPSRISALLASAGLAQPTRPELVRSILESLAVAYTAAVDALQTQTGTRIDTLHIVGGASQNALLCQLIANHSGRTLVAGATEATAIGNILVQARAAGVAVGDVDSLRDTYAHTFKGRRHEPCTDRRTEHP